VTLGIGVYPTTTILPTPKPIPYKLLVVSVERLIQVIPSVEVRIKPLLMRHNKIALG
jgi:hypothetical protein